MKKKMLALMLMLLAALSALTAAAEGSLPDVGEIISGFKVTQLYALDALGCAVSGYDQLRLAAREQVPCINNYGYYLSGGAWRDSSGAAAEPALSLYQHVQYAQLFDPKRRIDAWYEPLA